MGYFEQAQSLQKKHPTALNNVHIQMGAGLTTQK
jgi:hypothetical protein